MLVFNRPESTKLVFEAVRSARPSRLYIAADGPRPDRLTEHLLCEQVREIVSAVDWPCKLSTRFRETNIGCKLAVSDSISWFFQQETEGVILEDDCLPDHTFFEYCDELLERYREHPRVMGIGGNYFGDRRPAESEGASYFFSKRVEIWGWATWARAWNLYDRDIPDWPKRREMDWLFPIGGTREFERSWIRNFQTVYDGEVDTWDWQWVYCVWANDGLCVLPSRNLVANLGFGEDATHTKHVNELFDRIPLESMPFPLIHPSFVKRNEAMDRLLDKRLEIPLRSRIVNRLARLFRAR